MTLTLLLPYHPFDQPIQTPKGFDGTFYPPGMETVPKKAAIVQANRYMVDTCGYLIAYVWRSGSNALELTDYARRKGKPHIAYLPKKWNIKSSLKNLTKFCCGSYDILDEKTGGAAQP